MALDRLGIWDQTRVAAIYSAGVQGSLRISAIPNAFPLDKKAE